MTQPIVFFDNLPQTLEECLPVSIIQKNPFPSIASGSDMIYRPRIFYSKWSCHKTTIAQ